MENFASRFNAALKERHMSQAMISQITGIAHGTISNYANGKYSPKKDKRMQIANALGVSEAWLAGFDVPRDFSALSVDDQLSELEKDPSDQLSFSGTMVQVNDDELELLNKYRTLTQERRDAVRILIGDVE